MKYAEEWKSWDYKNSAVKEEEFAGLDVLFSYHFQLILQIDGRDINIRLLCWRTSTGHSWCPCLSSCRWKVSAIRCPQHQKSPHPSWGKWKSRTEVRSKACPIKQANKWQVRATGGEGFIPPTWGGDSRNGRNNLIVREKDPYNREKTRDGSNKIHD